MILPLGWVSVTSWDSVMGLQMTSLQRRAKYQEQKFWYPEATLVIISTKTKIAKRWKVIFQLEIKIFIVLTIISWLKSHAEKKEEMKIYGLSCEKSRIIIIPFLPGLKYFIALLTKSSCNNIIRRSSGFIIILSW